MRNPMWKASYKVRVDSFYYSWNRRSDSVVLGLKGEVMKNGIQCTFKIEHKHGQHKLEFPTAMVFDKTDPMEVALAVKNALIDYIRNSPEIPFMYREKIAACVMTHHKQEKIQ